MPTKKEQRTYDDHGVYKRSIGYIILLVSLWILHDFVIFLDLEVKYDSMTLSTFLANSIVVIEIAIIAIWFVDAAYNIDWSVE